MSKKRTGAIARAILTNGRIGDRTSFQIYHVKSVKTFKAERSEILAQAHKT